MLYRMAPSSMTLEHFNVQTICSPMKSYPSPCEILCLWQRPPLPHFWPYLASVKILWRHLIWFKSYRVDRYTHQQADTTENTTSPHCCCVGGKKKWCKVIWWLYCATVKDARCVVSSTGDESRPEQLSVDEMLQRRQRHYVSILLAVTDFLLPFQDFLWPFL